MTGVGAYCDSYEVSRGPGCFLYAYFCCVCVLVCGFLVGLACGPGPGVFRFRVQISGSQVQFSSKLLAEFSIYRLEIVETGSFTFRVEARKLPSLFWPSFFGFTCRYCFLHGTQVHHYLVYIPSTYIGLTNSGAVKIHPRTQRYEGKK